MKIFFPSITHCLELAKGFFFFFNAFLAYFPKENIQNQVVL